MELYQTQRAMRAMRTAALQRGVVAVLDVGSSKIGCLILKFEGLEEKIEADGVGSLAGQSGFQVIGSHSPDLGVWNMVRSYLCQKQRGQLELLFNRLRN